MFPLLCTLITFACAAVSVYNWRRTAHAHRKTATAYARIRMRRDRDAQLWAQIMTAQSGVEYCERCGLPYALIAPDQWDHPYCPMNYVTV